jgi:hypothetical protein
VNGRDKLVPRPAALSFAQQQRQQIQHQIVEGKWTVNFTLLWYSPAAVAAVNSVPREDISFRIATLPM